MLLRKFYCSELAVTCLWVKENTVYTGSFDANLKCFDLDVYIILSLFISSK